MKIQANHWYMAGPLSFLAVTTILLLTGCASERYDLSQDKFIDDKALDARVKDALTSNQGYTYNDVYILGYKGTVQLNGFVDNYWLKYHATSIALKVAGVQNVDNNLTVTNAMPRATGEYLDDKSTSARVNSFLINNADYKFEEVSITTVHGTVQLSGSVETPEQKNRATEIARRVEGVKDVVNTITVKDRM